jgi:hypothetical protein
MAGQKSEIGRLGLKIGRPAPPIWISRLVVYESTSPLACIIDQPLHLGLNVVWGVDEIPPDAHVEPVPGHSVGKTTFCRFLRFCLGEDHCADEQTRKLIRAVFPGGYVCAEVHVSGQTWAVARPLGRATISYARMGCRVEDIFAEHPLPQNFAQYRAALSAAGLTDESPRPDLPSERVWGHFLAWCARDQEARYESLWNWRSPRSGSDSPAFDYPKAEAVRFIRTTAGILSTKEITIQRRLDDAVRDIETLGEKIKEQERLPDYWCKHYREELLRLGVGQGTQGTQPGPLYDPTNAAEGRLSSIGEEVKGLDKELADLDRKVSIAAARADEAEQLVGGFQALKADSTMSEDDRAAALTGMEALLQKIRDAANRPCAYGGIAIGNCRYAQDNLITVGSQLQKARRTAASEVAERDQQTASVSERTSAISKTVAALRKEHADLLAKRRNAEDKRKGLAKAAEDIRLAVAELNRWGQYFRKDSPDPDLLSLRAKLTRAEEKVGKAKVDLRAERLAQETSLGGVRRIFNGLVQSILSQEYQGRVAIAEDDLEFQVSRGTRLAGEALQTLSILLADVTCMMLGAEGSTVHPGFVVHDSPREADLGLHVYQNYLQFMGLLHEHLGGAGGAPFQYIVTTTTPPPKAVQDSEAMVLKLSIGKLLLGRVLPEPKPDDADPAEGAKLWE